MEERYGKSESLAAGELDIPPMQAPEITDYSCDVLVIGCGWAGLNAAYAARKTGADVLVVDKGTPGYSGLSSFSSSHQWYDPEMGDDLQACLDEMVMANEYLANIGWYQEWAKHSKETYQRLMDWGLLTQYPTGSESGHWVDGDWRHDDLRGYHEEFLYADRRNRWSEILTENGIPYVPQTMIYDVIEENKKVVGAVGFHVPTATMIRFSAKAVVMCMGGAARSNRPVFRRAAIPLIVTGLATSMAFPLWGKSLTISISALPLPRIMC